MNCHVDDVLDDCVGRIRMRKRGTNNAITFRERNGLLGAFFYSKDFRRKINETKKPQVVLEIGLKCLITGGGAWRPPYDHSLSSRPGCVCLVGVQDAVTYIHPRMRSYTFSDSLTYFVSCSVTWVSERRHPWTVHNERNHLVKSSLITAADAAERFEQFGLKLFCDVSKK